LSSKPFKRLLLPFPHPSFAPQVAVRPLLPPYHHAGYSPNPPQPRLTPTRLTPTCSFNGFYAYYCSLSYNSLCAKIFDPAVELDSAGNAATTTLGSGGGTLALCLTLLVGTVILVRMCSGRNGKVWY
jgi:hypothetical protein